MSRKVVNYITVGVLRATQLGLDLEVPGQTLARDDGVAGEQGSSALLPQGSLAAASGGVGDPGKRQAVKCFVHIITDIGVQQQQRCVLLTPMVTSTAAPFRVASWEDLFTV